MNASIRLELSIKFLELHVNYFAEKITINIDVKILSNKKVCMQNGEAQLNHRMSTQCSTQYLSIKIPAPIPGHFCSSSPKLKLHQPKTEVFVSLALRKSLHKFNGEQRFEARYLT